jgi:hypothetical protein
MDCEALIVPVNRRFHTSDVSGVATATSNITNNRSAILAQIDCTERHSLPTDVAMRLGKRNQPVCAIISNSQGVHLDMCKPTCSDKAETRRTDCHCDSPPWQATCGPSFDCWMTSDGSSDRVGFAIGTGRCGTLFLYEVMGSEPAVASSHERNPENEAFHRYCKWHGCPSTTRAFCGRRAGDRRPRVGHSFGVSPYLALSVRSSERFGASSCSDTPAGRRRDLFVHKASTASPMRSNPECRRLPGPEPRPFLHLLRHISPRGDSSGLEREPRWAGPGSGSLQRTLARSPGRVTPDSYE